MNKLLHKINCKYSHLSLVIIFFFFSTHSSAKMPPTAFKSLSRVFHEQTRLYSPALGLPALESGLLENLRFFNIIAAYNEDGSRSYAQDTPFNQDAMASLVLKLFPSTGGQLSTISLHPANFGRYVKDPKSVALLLNFAFAVEKGVADKNLVIEEILDSLIFESQKTSYTIAQDTMQRGLLDIQNLEKSFSSQSFQTSFLMEALRDLSNQLPKNYASRLKPVVEAKSLVGNKKLNAKLWTRITQKINTTIDTEYKSSIKKLQKHLRPTIFSLLEAIELSIIQSHSFYPKGTTQQLINAFFCQHFNSRAEIKELLNSLDPQIVDPLRVARFSIADTIQEGDAALIAKNNYYDYDDIIALLTPDIFTNPIPYREGTALLSNESAHPYNRAKDQIIYNIDFADCTEMALRHIINLLIFDDKKKEFSLSHIKDQENNPYFNNLKYFYHKYGLESANAGDIKTRSAWNKVVGDLNFGSDSDDVAYIENTYNLDGGFENTIRVFEKLLGLRFDKPSNPKSKKEWIINCFTTIFTKFNPKNYYDIQLIKDTLSVQVNNNKNTPLFSFDYYSSSQVHAQIQNLKIDLKSESRSSVKIPITRGTTEESLLLLENNKLPQNSPSHLLYTIMPKISGHTLIEKISKIHPNESVNNDTDRTLQNILKTALNQFNWDDLHTITTHVEKFLLLSKHPLFHEVISLNCRHIVIPVESYLPQNSNSHDVLRQLSEFSGLERLTINNDEFVSLDLKKFKNLKRIKLNHTNNLKFLDISDLENLEYLKITSTNGSLESIDGLATLKNLKTLHLSSHQSMGPIDLRPLLSLESLDLSMHMDHSKTLALDGLINLKKIRLCLKGLENLRLNGLENLLEINIINAHTLSSIDGMSDLNNLEKWSIANGRILTAIDLSSLKKLRTLFLEAVIDNLDLSGLENLEEFTFRIGGNLPKIQFLENLKNLKIVRFEDMFATQKIDLSGLINVEEIKILANSLQEIEGLHILQKFDNFTINNSNNYQTIINKYSPKKLIIIPEPKEPEIEDSSESMELIDPAEPLANDQDSIILLDEEPKMRQKSFSRDSACTIL